MTLRRSPGCGGSLSGSTYTTGAITGACTVMASFSTSSVITDSTTGMLLLKIPARHLYHGRHLWRRVQ